MQSKKILSIGYGDIAQRYSKLFLADDCKVTAMARSNKTVAEGVQYLKAAVESREAETLLATHHYNAAIITLTPGGSDDSAYQQAYVNNLKKLIDLWENNHNAPDLVLFVSSTSVYSQCNGEWVDENSIAQPKRFNGERLLEAENLLKQSRLNHCIVRFTGIYGPKRHYLLNQVKSGVVGGEHFTNRIHADDCAGILHFLCNQYWQGNLQHRLYLGTDNSPVKSREINAWLAKQMGFDEAHLKIPSLSTRSGNKRCCNKRLLENGYHFLYPTYKEGYLRELEALD